MNVLVTGGASSGKSAFAEKLACSLPAPHVYLATMSGSGAEAQARIARHRAMRDGKGFITVECATCVASADLPEGAREGTLLFEDLGNLVSNAMFAPEFLSHPGSMPCPRDLAADLAGDVLELSGRCGNVVVVANEVGCDGVRYDSLTESYIECIGAVACKLASDFDTVVEVVAGQPLVVKGVLP